MKNFRKQFPIVKQYTYLNTAASGLLSEKLLEFRTEHDLDLLISASILRQEQDKILSKTREAVGNFFTCLPEQVALVPNFSYGLNTLLEGIEKGKKILLLENDYPSINWAVEARDFEISYAKIDENLEQNIMDAINTHKPDIFAFSIVQYINGIKIDFDFLNSLKQDHPELLIIGDGTQYCGTEFFNFEKSAFDAVGCSSYKWMNAGYGNAFFLFKKSVEEKIFPKYLGFNSLQGKHKQQEGSFIGKLEPGHQDTLNYGSLLTAIQLFKQLGPEKIYEQVFSISKKAKIAFEELDLLEPAVKNRNIHSSIFNIKGDDKLFNFLNEEGIICSQRGDGIRVSFHFFNTEEELEFLIEKIKEFRK